MIIWFRIHNTLESEKRFRIQQTQWQIKMKGSIYDSIFSIVWNDSITGKASSWVHNFKCVWYHKLSICILWKKGGERNMHQYVESIKSRKTNESLCKYFCVLCKWTSLFLLEKFCANKFLLSPFKDDVDDFKRGWKFYEWILSSCSF